MTTPRTFLFAVFVAAPTLVNAQWHGADVPDSLSFQGFLTDTSGTAVTDGDYDLLFRMYKGSTKVWEQTHSVVPVKSGGFNVILSGSVTWPLDTVAFNQAIDLGITINGGSELTPRTPLTSAAYALGMRGLSVVHAEDASNRIAPNLIGGASNNYVAQGVVGATIGGGGGFDESVLVPDSVLGRWGTVGGGLLNTAGPHGTVGGGAQNRALNTAAVGGGAGNSAAGYGSIVGGGIDNAASGIQSSIGGGFQNRALGAGAAVQGGENNAAAGEFSFIGGGRNNIVVQFGSTIAGGYSNWASGDSSAIGGGSSNLASRRSTVIAGGSGNKASGAYATVGGGQVNLASADYATVSGGAFNQAGEQSFVGGGVSNEATGLRATIPGGYLNTARANNTFAAGYNAKAGHEGSFVWSDRSQTVLNLSDSLFTTADNQFLIRAAGGVGIGTNAPGSQLTVHGVVESDSLGFKFPDGTIQTSAAGSGSAWSLTGNAGTTPGTDFIGTSDNTALEIKVNASRVLRIEPAFDAFNKSPNLIGGASNNFVAGGVVGATIGGGGGWPAAGARPDSVLGDWGTVGGGYSNVAGDRATVGGGDGNTATGQRATVGGGSSNRASASSATVGGGSSNTVSDIAATVGGGSSNRASGNAATVGGGLVNTASGNSATVGGGQSNIAGGVLATVPGGWLNGARGDFSLAAGYKARANHEGSFVWNDRSVTSGNDSLLSTGPNQFLIRAAGGVGIGTNAPASQLTVHGVVESDSLGFKFPDGTIQTSAAVLGSAWSLSGNAGTTPGTDFIGTTDDAAFEIKVNSSRALRIEPAVDAKAEAPNLIGGASNNFIENGVLGATISGGGGLNVVGIVVSNSVLADWGTVGGGRSNSARGSRATIGGGDNNLASGRYSTIPGGNLNIAAGGYSFAAGHNAHAVHNGSFVWADSAVNLFSPFASTNENQFLIRAAGGVGIGTNAPVEALHVKEASGSTGIFLGGDGTAGPHGVIFDDDTPNEGVSLLWRTGPNQLVIERGSAGTGADSADAFVYDRDDDSFRFNGGNVVLSRDAQSASHQLELRNVGDITNTSYDGIRFTQGASGQQFLADIRLEYRNNGNPDMSFSLRSATDLLFLSRDAKVGIGTTTPSEKLEVNGNALANAHTVPSDRRLKRNIQSLTNSLATVGRLSGVSYQWRTDEYPERGFDDGRHIGFIAQDVEHVVPEAVQVGSDGTYSMRYQEIIPILVEAVKELSAKVESQQKMISELQSAMTN